MSSMLLMSSIVVSVCGVVLSGLMDGRGLLVSFRLLSWCVVMSMCCFRVLMSVL